MPSPYDPHISFGDVPRLGAMLETPAVPLPPGLARLWQDVYCTLPVFLDALEDESDNIPGATCVQVMRVVRHYRELVAANVVAVE